MGVVKCFFTGSVPSFCQFFKNMRGNNKAVMFVAHDYKN